MSVANFYAIFELYCPATGTFFTPVGELGMALHEMWEVSALPLGSFPYEEYFPCEAELTLLEKKEPALFETYRELMCHLYICSSIHGRAIRELHAVRRAGGIICSPTWKMLLKQLTAGLQTRTFFEGCKNTPKGI